MADTCLSSNGRWSSGSLTKHPSLYTQTRAFVRVFEEAYTHILQTSQAYGLLRPPASVAVVLVRAAPAAMDGMNALPKKGATCKVDTEGL